MQKPVFLSRGWTLKDIYINSKTKLKCICPEGHNTYIRWNDLEQDIGCSYCSGQVKPSYEFVKKMFEQEGYILLSKSYHNSRNKLNYVCTNGHNDSMPWRDFRRGHRCKKCAFTNENNPAWKGGTIKNNFTLYGTYVSRLEKYHIVFIK